MSTTQPKLLLAAINSKYIHSNLAVYSLQKYAEVHTDVTVEIAEYTINQPLGKILQDILRKGADVLFFSCYIWNIAETKALISDITKVRPDIDIWLGGPEVTYDPDETFRQMPGIKGLTRGEGEEAFEKLVRYYMTGEVELADIYDITYRNDAGDVTWNPESPRLSLDDIEFVYDDLAGFENRIIYYESSRGCPYRCSYCLSSVDKALAFRSIGKVEEELQFFLDHNVPQVKFIDRTFNCSHERTEAIWNYINEHDNGITNFHFEIAADIMTDAEIAILNTMRPGLVQLEIGVQSTNVQTIHEINRPMSFERVSRVVEKILAPGNVHVHLDLIAGLPYEDAESFRQSFNDVYGLHPHQLQLGFLKVLSGSPMEAHAEIYGLKYSDQPPYEVLETKWISYGELSKLKYAEDMVDSYYNSGQFGKSLAYLQAHGDVADAYGIFEGLADYYAEHEMDNINLSRNTRYLSLIEYAKTILREEDMDGLMQAVTYDYYARDNVRSRPDFLGEDPIDKPTMYAFYNNEVENHTVLHSELFVGADNRLIRKHTHMDRIGGKLVVFDYTDRNPVTGNVTMIELES